MGAGLEDAAGHREVEAVTGEQQPRQQVEPAEAAEVADRRGVALADVDEAGVHQPLQASRTAGRETPRTSARRRSLGSGSPGAIEPPSISPISWS